MSYNLKKEGAIFTLLLFIALAFIIPSVVFGEKKEDSKKVKTYTNQDLWKLKQKKKGAVTILNSDTRKPLPRFRSDTGHSQTIPAMAEWTWYVDADGYRQALKIAQQYRAPILLYFYTDWCGLCRVLREEYWADARVRQGIRPFVKVRINPEHSLSDKKIARRYRVRGFPTIIVLRPDGKQKRFFPFRSKQGKTELMHPADFIALLHSFAFI